MQAKRPENPEDAEFDELFAGTVFELDAGSVLEKDSGPDFEPPAFSEISGTDTESSLETSPKTETPVQLILPVGVSIAVHICLLLLLRQLMPGTDSGANDIEVQPPSIRISFRPRPTAPPEPQTIAQEQPTEPEPETAVNEAPPPASEEPPAQAIADQTAEETESLSAPSPAPRLLAPALLDVRDLIQNRAQNDATARIYNNTNCDERQRRTDLIDCGDEDPNAQYDFAAAEQNATVEFFTELAFPTEDTRSQPPDRTSTAARTRAAQQNMTGNLGAAPLIRSVLGEPQ